MNDYKTVYIQLNDFALRQKHKELIEFLRKIFDNKDKTDEFLRVQERYEFVEDELRKRVLI